MPDFLLHYGTKKLSLQDHNLSLLFNCYFLLYFFSIFSIAPVIGAVFGWPLLLSLLSYFLIITGIVSVVVRYRNGRLLLLDGFAYRVSRRRPHSIHWRCRTPTCKGTAKTVFSYSLSLKFSRFMPND